MTCACVAVTVGDHVATVVVDNPPVNALDDATLEALTGAAQELGGREDVRAVVLTGAGDKAFVAGADLNALRSALGPDGEPGEMERHVSLTRPMFASWTGLPQPVIAAVGANAVGGGLELALACDLIVADPGARFGLPEVKLGLMPGGGGTQRLARRVGRATALELVLLGRVVTAHAAEELGIVDIVAAPGRALAEAQELAGRLAAQPARAVQAAKRAVSASSESPMEQGLEIERELFLAVAASADAREGATAFLEKRPPRFEHR